MAKNYITQCARGGVFWVCVCYGPVKVSPVGLTMMSNTLVAVNTFRNLTEMCSLVSAHMLKTFFFCEKIKYAGATYEVHVFDNRDKGKSKPLGGID